MVWIDNFVQSSSSCVRFGKICLEMKNNIHLLHSLKHELWSSLLKERICQNSRCMNCPPNVCQWIEIKCWNCFSYIIWIYLTRYQVANGQAKGELQNLTHWTPTSLVHNTMPSKLSSVWQSFSYIEVVTNIVDIQCSWCQTRHNERSGCPTHWLIGQLHLLTNISKLTRRNTQQPQNKMRN